MTTPEQIEQATTEALRKHRRAQSKEALIGGSIVVIVLVAIVVFGMFVSANS